MTEPKWVTRQQVEFIHDAVIEIGGGLHDLRDAALLESALARPQNQHAYGEKITSQLAASYAEAISRNNAFVDGNKRTAFYVIVDFLEQNGLPIRYELTSGQAHHAPPCKTLLNNLKPGKYVLADKAYDADWIRQMIWEQGAIDVIPPKANRKLPAEFDAEIYRERNKIERFFGRLKSSFRRIATRYEKTSRNFLSIIKLASIRL
jgi:death-on-curing family protein